MTPNPECCDPNMTVLEALQVMHDNKFLILPICEKDGSVVGIVDVIDLIYGCRGSEGWKSMFRATLDMDGESVTSRTVKSHVEKDERTVCKLRPNNAIISNSSDTILHIC